MKVIEQVYQIEWFTPDPLRTIERVGRVCYKSEDKITEDSAGEFVRMLVRRGHTAMIEHASLSVRFITDRGISHELVRHRLASFAQESTRYVGYGDANGGVTYIRPYWVSQEQLDDLEKAMRSDRALPASPAYAWWIACSQAETSYKNLLRLGSTPQEARQALNNSTKTEIVITANFREWMTIFRLRDDKSAHPQMQALMKPLHTECATMWPEVFGPVGYME